MTILHESGLREKFEWVATATNHLILINAVGGFTRTTDLAVILQNEILQLSGGYAPQPLTYIANAGTYNSVDKCLETTITAAFNATGAPYSYTHVAMWRGRGGTSSKTIDSINTSTNNVTVTAHGLNDGDRAFITSTATRPSISSGEIAIQRYWVQRIDANNIRLHTNVGLSAPVDFVGAGTGTLSLRYANGSLWYFFESSGTVNPGSPRSIEFTLREFDNS